MKKKIVYARALVMDLSRGALVVDQETKGRYRYLAGRGQTSAVAPRFAVKLKGLGVVVKVFGKTSAGSIVCIVEKSAPGSRSATLDIRVESIRRN